MIKQPESFRKFTLQAQPDLFEDYENPDDVIWSAANSVTLNQAERLLLIKYVERLLARGTTEKEFQNIWFHSSSDIYFTRGAKDFFARIPRVLKGKKRTLPAR